MAEPLRTPHNVNSTNTNHPLQASNVNSDTNHPLQATGDLGYESPEDTDKQVLLVSSSQTSHKTQVIPSHLVQQSLTFV